MKKLVIVLFFSFVSHCNAADFVALNNTPTLMVQVPVVSSKVANTPMFSIPSCLNLKANSDGNRNIYCFYNEKILHVKSVQNLLSGKMYITVYNGKPYYIK